MKRCRKRRYPDKVEAMIALSRTELVTVKRRKQGHLIERREESRVYECPDCRGWHLTSWS